MESGIIDIINNEDLGKTVDKKPIESESAFKSRHVISRRIIGKKGFLKEALLRGIKLLSLSFSLFTFLLILQKFYIVNAIANVPMPILFFGLIYATLIICFSRIYNSYLVGVYRISELICSQGLSNFFSVAIMYALMCVLSSEVFNPLPLMALLLIHTIWSMGWNFFANKIFIALYPPMKTAILYRKDEDLIKLKQVKRFSMKFDIQYYIRDPKESDDLYTAVKECSAIFMIGVDMELRNKIAEFGVKNKIRVYLAPQLGDVLVSGAKHMEMFSIPIFQICSSSLTPEYALIKRLFDLSASFLGLLVFCPIMIVTAVAIKLYDGGPVLYKQIRLTRNGCKFKILKFRSMCVDAEKDGVVRMACENDCRITPIGKIIRATRIDELPQLMNILVGQMSFVGPRPERPELALEYEQKISEFSLRLQVKAGLTGCAQVYGQYNTTPYEKLQMDLMYINNMSIIEDLKLIFATVKILFLPESTEGVAEGQTTAMDYENEADSTENRAETVEK